MSQPDSFKTKISAYAERNKIRAALKAMAGITWKTLTEQYCEYRLDGTASNGTWIRAKQYINGTFWLQSNEPALLRQALVELGFESGSSSEVQSSSGKGNFASAAPDCYIGTDESGKGDYFGPLVIAGVWVTPETAQKLASIGAKDCKALNDADVRRLSPQIKTIVGHDAWAVQVWRPKLYNQNIDTLKQHGQTLNDLMAAGHAKVIERIDAQLNESQPVTPQPNTTGRRALVDQFSKKPLVQQVLNRAEINVKVQQETKAEDKYIAVAAASIIARAEFLTVMDELSEAVGETLPKGAGSNVNRVAKKLWLQQGELMLQSVCKWHFKTTQTVKGMV